MILCCLHIYRSALFGKHSILTIFCLLKLNFFLVSTDLIKIIRHVMLSFINTVPADNLSNRLHILYGYIAIS